MPDHAADPGAVEDRVELGLNQGVDAKAAPRGRRCGLGGERVAREREHADQRCERNPCSEAELPGAHRGDGSRGRWSCQPSYDRRLVRVALRKIARNASDSGRLATSSSVPVGVVEAGVSR